MSFTTSIGPICLFELNEHLKDKSYLCDKCCPTQLDYTLCKDLHAASIDPEIVPHLDRWYLHISKLMTKFGPYDVRGNLVPPGPAIEDLKLGTSAVGGCKNGSISNAKSNGSTATQKHAAVTSKREPAKAKMGTTNVSSPTGVPKTQEAFDAAQHPVLSRLQCKRFTMDASILACPLGELVILNAVMINVQNNDVAGVWKQQFAEAWILAQESNLDLKTDKRVVAFEDFVKASGVLPATKKKPQSCLAMLKRCYSKAAPFSVSPIVDFYNYASVSLCISAGGFALDELEGDLTLRMSREGDSFEPFDANSEAEAIPAGEVSYTVGSTIVTRHLAYKQSRTGILKPSSSVVFLQFELQPWMLAEHVHTALEQKLRAYSSSHAEAANVEVRLGYTSREQPSWTWVA